MQPLPNESQSAATASPPRKRFTPEQREAVLGRFHQSGLTQAEFVAREGISKAALGKWLARARRQKAPALKPVSFEELRLPSPKPAWAVEITNPRNWTVRLAQVPAPTALQQLLAALPC